MTNTVLFDLQAAAMAAAANSGQKLPGAEDIPEGGSSFSEILALQNTQNVQTSQTGATEAAGETAAADGSAEAVVEENPDNSAFAEALKRIENSDDAVKKALTLLLKTVLNAMRGASDGEERKTDMFMILSDGSAGFSDEDDLLGEDILLGAEIMNRLGIMLETAAEKETEPDVLLGELEKIVSAILGAKDDEDSDEITAADALAAMLNIPPEEIESLEAADSETKAEAVGNAAEALKAPMEAIKQEAPEKVPEAEKLYSEFAAEVVSETEEVPETPVRAGFSALKINNASEQVNNIGRRTSVETEEIPEQPVEAKAPAAETNPVSTEDEKSEKEAADDTADDRTDEIAALGAETESIFVRGDIGTEKVETELKPETARSVEAQVKEVVTDEISEFGDKDGVKELVLILKPKELGQIAVKLIKEADTVSVVMSAQYGEVGKLMSQRAAYLSESLSDRNYQVKDVQIVEPGNAAEQMGLNFTDHGFSFARNSGGSESGRDHRGENDGYGEIDGIGEIAADHGEIRLREAKLWTTA
ncbi:MAG: flagellar hook-length control protein FliK [Oscillospiraceae bacterium]|nr:flagellar hook-length control protein FliK [Oscillospiraceae bacterium]